MKAATGDAFPLRRFISTFQSTPPVKAATVKGKILDGQTDISIHAAREGGDPLQRLLALKHVYFNPRRP